MKRFTETTKWDDPWFMDLPLKYKLFWLYICDKCDNAGAWQPNIRLATAQIGEGLELAEVLRVFSDRIIQLDDGKLFITKFIPFQYGNLSPNCRAHIPILNNIEKLRVSKGYPKGIHTLVEKETEKDKEKEGRVREGFKKPTLAELEDAFGSKKFANEFFDFYESNGWRVGRNPMKDWRAAARRWKGNSVTQTNNRRDMSAFEIEKRTSAIVAEINKIWKKNGARRVDGDGIDELKQRRDELQKQMTA